MQQEPFRTVMSSLSALGEFGLIERLAQIVTPMPSAPALPGAGGLLLGIGDDAAVWTPTPGTRVVATTDALVEGVHFDLRFTSWRDLGWKALAVNVSDAAAMGATPRFALVTLGLSRGRSLEELESLYHGLADHAARFAVQVVGGDVVSSPTTFLSVALLAEAGAHLLRRDAARPGDQVAVTGTLGDAAGGLRLLLAGRQPRTEAERELVRRHNRPEPRVPEAALLRDSGVRCGMDLSDGLLGDCARLARASGVQIELRLDAVPVSAALREVFGEEAAEIALAGGEDYELLVTGRAEVLRAAVERLRTAGLTPLSLVGQVRERSEGAEEVGVLDSRGERYTPRLRSWEHPL